MPHKTYVSILSFLLFNPFSSCCFSTKNTSLGNDFKLSEYNVKETGIMYCFDNCCNSGITVIPQTVIAYNFNTNWIIAKSDSTYHNNRNDFAYWIFKKDVALSKENLHDSIAANLLGPLDSITFYKMLFEKNIQLQLKNYPK